MAQDRNQIMQGMLAQMGPNVPNDPNAQDTPEPNDPKDIIDQAVDQVSNYIDNPEQVTPETLQDLLAMLQKASAALGPEA